MIKVDNLKEISIIKKTKNYFTFLLLMENDDKNIILSEYNGVIHIYNSHTNFEEIFTIIFNEKKNSNTIQFISLMNKKNILVTFKDIIRCISINKKKESTNENENKFTYEYNELFSMSLNLRGFDFYQCISLQSMENYLVSSCEKEIIHSWTNSSIDSQNRQYKVKKVLSVCKKDTSSFLLEIPVLKLLVSCSFKDCVLKFFDLSQNFKLLKKIDKLGQSYYIGCLKLINSHLFIVTSEGINGMLLIDARYKEIVQKYEINGYKGWVNSIYANISYNDSNPNNIVFYIGGTFIDDKKNITSDFQQYEIGKGEIKLVNKKSNVHEESITSIIYYNPCHLSDGENENKNFYFLSFSKSNLKIWNNS